MINITHKTYTHRKAIATAIVRLSSESAKAAIESKQVPKGDVFEMAKTAALFAAKRTSDMIPDCHPLPIEYVRVSFNIHDLDIEIEVEIQTIYKTGVEVEAMHAASVAALTIYDMMKPLDKNITIERIKLLEKTGGKSDYLEKLKPDLKAAVVVCSDSVSSGKKTDKAGKAIVEKLLRSGIEATAYLIIPDEAEKILSVVNRFVQEEFDLVILTGGTGLSKRDITPEALEGIIDRPIPGIEEAMRSYGQQRTPYAMLSRSVAGFAKNTLILALPGSTRGAEESMDAVFPHLLHLFRIVAGARHN